MGTKNKIIKTAKIFSTVCKVFYCLACAACVAFIALAVALSCTNAIKSFTAGETAILFGTLALYSFMAIGLLWNIEQIFVNIVKEQAPFSKRTSRYLKKTGVFSILLSTVPALIGTMLLHSIVPSTELNFSIELVGIIVGIVLIIFCRFFEYGNELENINK